MGMTESREINGLSIVVEANAASASQTVAERIAAQIRRKPESVLGLATGGTPVETYRRLAEMYRLGQIDFDRVTSFNLDEYIGLSGEHPQSFRAFMDSHLFSLVNIDPLRTFVPDGLAEDVAAHCADYESWIRSSGGIDLQLLGLGHNGHIAFNEPGSSPGSRTRRVDLTRETIQKNSRFFDSIDQVPRHAITMGIATILESREIIILALGAGKAEAVARMVQGPITALHPASLLRNHQRVTVVLDRPAAESLGNE
jgi:glucosamine-6-phosphate deaminase